jgi:hypothetical protein
MNKKLTICYERLSRDDYNGGAESGSIANQRDILQAYAEQTGLLYCHECAAKLTQAERLRQFLLLLGVPQGCQDVLHNPLHQRQKY